ncbi:metal ABC transporter solute-binding protein, Zn/Mn family [Aeromicrobium sp. CTD01-1L150]|uniref:metal ABC transporter substrate-binding protein n=1 Tax=Aeromicrobium sp. CTD01-1L150 TaxID=3341830 RepID=UPI0035C1E6D7
MRRLLLPAVAAITLSPALVACGAGADDDDRLTVVASFYPVAFVAERVGGEDADVEVLSKPGVDAHDLELAPKQVAAVQDADVLLYQSGFQTAVDEAVEQADRDEDTTVDSTAGVDLIEDDGADEDHGHEDEDEDSHEDHGHEDEDSHEDHDHGDEDHGHEDGHEGHDHGPGDPHIWLDPLNMVTLTRNAEQAMSAADPDNAEAYSANADALVAELRELDADLSEGLATCETRDIVVSHAAFGYLARSYDLHQVPIAGIDPSNEPTAAQLAKLADLVDSEGISTVFTERLVSSAVADTVAREAGVETAVLDPLEGLDEETADEDYLSIMRQNLQAITQANGCS